MTYLWTETSGLLPAGAFNPSKPTLAIKVRVTLVWAASCAAWLLAACCSTQPPRTSHAAARCQPIALPLQGPISGLAAGTQLTFTFTASLEGAGSASTSLALTAQSSELMAVISGPSGDVLVRLLGVLARCGLGRAHRC